MRPPFWQMEDPMNNKGIPMVRRQTTAWEKKEFASYSFDRRFMSSIYKNNKKPTNQPNNKCSHIFLSGKYRLKLIDANLSSQCQHECEKETLGLVMGVQARAATLKICREASQKNQKKNCNINDPAVLPLIMYPKDFLISLQRYLHIYTLCHSTYNSQEMKSIWMSIK